MVSGITSNYSFQKPLYTKSSSSVSSQVNNSNLNTSNSILPQKKKTVTVDGEVYEVVKVNANDGKFTFAPEYKEVVIIDGKQYDVNGGNSLNGILA